MVPYFPVTIRRPQPRQILCVSEPRSSCCHEEPPHRQHLNGPGGRGYVGRLTVPYAVGLLPSSHRTNTPSSEGRSGWRRRGVAKPRSRRLVPPATYPHLSTGRNLL